MTNPIVEQARQAIANHIACPEKPIGILFSGGKDSTVLTTLLCLVYPESELTLITVNNGHIYPQELRAKTMERRNKISALTGCTSLRHVYLDVKNVLKANGLKPYSFIHDRYTYVYLCVDCKIAMHLAASEWAVRNGVDTIVDGYAARQDHNPEQTDIFRASVYPALQNAFGVNNISPLYDVLATDQSLLSLLEGLGYSPRDDFGLGKDDDFGWKGQAKCALMPLTYRLYEDLVVNRDSPAYARNRQAYRDELEAYLLGKMAGYLSEGARQKVKEAVNRAVLLA